jgi:hypothetical protein
MTRPPTTEPDPRGLDDDHQIDLALELARLDALQATHWPRALTGDIAAAEAWLGLMDRKILLLAEDRTGKRH